MLLSATAFAQQVPAEPPAADLELPVAGASNPGDVADPSPTAAPESVPAQTTRAEDTSVIMALPVAEPRRPPAPAPQHARPETRVEGIRSPPAASTRRSRPADREPRWLDATPYSYRSSLGLRTSGFLQAQYEHSDLSEDQLRQGGEPLNLDRFSLRRARLRFDRGWKYAGFTLELDANTVHGLSVGARRAEGSLLYRGTSGDSELPLAVLTGGVTDVPFGYELGQSARVRVFMERSIGSLALFPTEMDVGAKVHGSIAFLRYAVAVMNGETTGGSGISNDRNAAKDVIGRLGAEASPWHGVKFTGGLSLASGSGFHPGSGATKDTVVWLDENEDGIVQPTNELVAIPGTAATPSESFRRWAFGLDLGVAVVTTLGSSRLYGEANVASNHDRGLLPSDPVVTGFDARQAGGYVALVQDLWRYALVGCRFSVYDPNADLSENRAGRLLPFSQVVRVISAVGGFVVSSYAQVLAQYDVVRDSLARNAVGVPTDARNNQLTVRLQVAR